MRLQIRSDRGRQSDTKHENKLLNNRVVSGMVDGNVEDEVVGNV